jgi:RimJ/RimL family protein N-acetyltransferase
VQPIAGLARRVPDVYRSRVSQLVDVPWPPDETATDRLLVRCTKPSDRPAYVELLCTDAARRYLGGALDRAEIEATVPATPGYRPGVFAVESSSGEFIGSVSLDRRDPHRPGHVSESGNEVEISYMFLPAAWGKGYATEAVAAVLVWADAHLASEPIVVCTQAANEASVRLATRVGFREVERLVEFDAEQWFGVRDSAPLPHQRQAGPEHVAEN